MSFTIREIEKYSKIQLDTAEWVAERVVYICKVLSEEVEGLSEIIQNQKEVFEKEHSDLMTMKQLAYRLKYVTLSDITIVPSVPQFFEPGEIKTFKLHLPRNSAVRHIGLAFVNLNDAFCRRLAESMVTYFEGYNISIVFILDLHGEFFIDIRTNGINRPEDYPYYPL